MWILGLKGLRGHVCCPLIHDSSFIYFIQSSTWNPVFTAQHPKSKTLLDSLKSSSKIAACGLFRHDVEG